MRSKAGLLGWGAMLLMLGSLLCFVPLLNLLGFEFAFALTLPVGLCAAAQGVHARRLTGPWRAWGRASVYALMLALLPLIPITLNMLRVRNCNYTEGLAFYLALPLSTAIVGAGWGVAAARLAPRRGIWLVVAGLLVTVAISLARLYLYPPVDAYHPLLGYYPGPLFDEVIPLGWRLVSSRLEDLGGAAALVALSALRTRRTWAHLALASLALCLTHLFARDHDVHRDTAYVQAALGGRHETAHVVLYHPKAWPAAQVRRLGWDLEFAHAELRTFFDLSPSWKAQVYFYPDSAMKKRLVGAGRTKVAKPWQRAMHIHTPRIGARVTVHELAHVFSYELAPGPLHLSLHRGVVPHMTLIEGLAVAAAWSEGPMDPHRKSAAMQRLDHAPRLADLIKPQGFFTQNSRTAYTLCGSFVRHFRDRHGPAAMGAAYRAGDFEVVGEPFDQQIETWRAALRRETVPPQAMTHAKAQLNRTAIFDKTCAHEIAALRRAAIFAEPERAIALYDELRRHIPGDPGARLGQIQRLFGLGRMVQARREIDALEVDDRVSALVRAEAQEWRADLQGMAGETVAARVVYDALLAAALHRATVRRLLIKRQALDHGATGRAVLKLLRGVHDPTEMRAQISALMAHTDDWPGLRYLWGRHHLHETPQAAIEALGVAAAELEAPALVLEAQRLVAAYYFDQEDYARANQRYAALSQRTDLGLHPGEREGLARWARRASFFATQARRTP